MSANIVPGEKVTIIANTGSGKTFVARSLLLRKKYVIVLDAKGEYSWSDSGHSPYDDVYTDLDDLKQNWKGPSPAIYRPDMFEVRTGCEAFFKWAWYLRSPLVYIDELHDICPTGHPGFWLEKCIKQGRSRKLSIWYGTQRPAGIPSIVLSESTHFFVGRLLMPQDRKRVAEVIHPSLNRLELPKYKFVYVNTDTRKPQPFDAVAHMKGGR